jgi:hypothetical protein
VGNHRAPSPYSTPHREGANREPRAFAVRTIGGYRPGELLIESSCSGSWPLPSLRPWLCPETRPSLPRGACQGRQLSLRAPGRRLLRPAPASITTAPGPIRQSGSSMATRHRSPVNAAGSITSTAAGYGSRWDRHRRWRSPVIVPRCPPRDQTWSSGSGGRIPGRYRGAYGNDERRGWGHQFGGLLAPVEAPRSGGAGAAQVGALARRCGFSPRTSMMRTTAWVSILETGSRSRAWAAASTSGAR